MEGIKLTSISTGSWVRLLVVVALGYAFLEVSEFILVLIASIVIASAVEPITMRARRQGFPRLPTVVVIYIVGALLFSAFFYFLLLPLIGEVSAFVRTLNVYFDAALNDSVLSGMFETQNLFGGLDTPIVAQELSTYLNSASNFLSQGIFSSASTVVGGVVNFVLMIVLSFYLAVQEDGVGKFLKIITPVGHESYIVGLWRRSQRKIGLWMQGQLILGILVGIMVYIGLLFIGVDHALLLAVIAGVLELIPMFGPVIAAIPAVFVAYATLGGIPTIIVIALYILIQQLENHVLSPLVVKKIVGMPPMVSIIAIVVGGHLAGFLGMLIAVPVAAVIMELLADVEEKKVAAEKLTS